MGLKVKEVQPTPNPNALKFVMDGVLSESPMSFLTAEQGTGNALAEALFKLRGVTSVLILGDFVTVNKAADTKWGAINDKIREILEKSA